MPSESHTPSRPERTALAGRIVAVSLIVLFAALVGAVAAMTLRRAIDRSPVRVGVLVATDGERAAFDAPTLVGALAAIDLVNERGGVLHGRILEAVVRDSGSSPAQAADAAQGLVRDERAVAIVGGTSPLVRRAIADRLDEAGGTLVCPTSSEGLDDHPSLVVLGSLPNQRIVPAIAWCVRERGPRIMLLSDEGLQQRVVHEILRDHVPAIGGVLVGEAWMRAGDGEEAAVAAVLDAKPDAIVAGLGRASAEAFARALRAAAPEVRPTTLHWQLRLGEVATIEPGLLEGDHIAASTFVDATAVDRAFLDAYRRRAAALGIDERPDPRAISAADAILLVAAAIDRSGGRDPGGVQAAMLGARVRGTSGAITIDPRSRAAWKPMRVGRIGSDGTIVEVWATDGAVRPRPWPRWRSREEWRALVASQEAQR